MAKESGKYWKNLVDPFPPTHGKDECMKTGAIFLYFLWDFFPSVKVQLPHKGG